MFDQDFILLLARLADDAGFALFFLGFGFSSHEDW
jgi:hypothetical protein